MRLYQISFRGHPDGHQGYEYVTSAKEANRRKREWEKEGEYYTADVAPIEVTPTKEGILRALNAYASHNDNG